MVTISARGDRLVLGLQNDIVLLDVNDSQALEFSQTDDADARDLEQVVRAFCAGELEVQVGARDGKYYALRGGGVELTLPSGVLSFLRSGPRRWSRIH